MKKQYYILPTDCYGQPIGTIEPIMLTEEEYQKRRLCEYIYEDYMNALYRAMD